MTKEQCIDNYLDYLVPILKKSKGISLWDFTLKNGEVVYIYYNNSEERGKSVAFGTAFINHLKSYFDFGNRTVYYDIEIKRYFNKICLI